jgi:hypothetical protein
MIYPKYEIKVFLYSIKNNKVNIIWLLYLYFKMYHEKE